VECFVWHELPQQLGVSHSHPPRFGAVVLQFDHPVAQV
jgi:hypothetical protein